MRPFTTSLSGQNSCSLLDIRLDQDLIIFRGNYPESSDQLLKGVVVLSLFELLRVEDVRLRLIGTVRLSWTDDTSNLNLSGVLSRKVDKTRTLVNHKWAPFVGRRGKSMTLPAGNYEFPFELVLRGDTAETVEGLPDASITYCLQATARCGKVPYGLHAKKCLRIVRTFKPGTIALPQALSINNIWCNKVDYSITIPQKAVVFGEAINIEMQFTPLLKGLELREITARFLETRLTWVQMLSGLILKLHRTEREASMWKLEINHKEHWHDIIEHTGQAGWSFVKTLNLPKQLHMCTQDLNHDGIEVRHRIKVAATIKGPDGQISELCATLPVSIFMSPNISFDEHGNVVDESPIRHVQQDVGVLAPPSYGEHLLDQRCDDIDAAGFQPGILPGSSNSSSAHLETGSATHPASMAYSSLVHTGG